MTDKSIMYEGECTLSSSNSIVGMNPNPKEKTKDRHVGNTAFESKTDIMNGTSSGYHLNVEDEIGSEDEISCPLFMNSLPKDFSTNPALAAIANLLDDDSQLEEGSETKNEKSSTTGPIFSNPGGGKLKHFRGNRTSSIRRAMPYRTEHKKQKASVGEAQ
eukprot:CAMPEP_0184866018 /NCGR_PEP_ID=MMETSP0580-20130426/20282_1 /TAXON_ID=1118495 /ORGANISM="Dactyliosolen fragilissimus" /LENGTH=159 /DNA_ID=CAMNT_0027365451 /DNA_START=331 /DNA_END=807 /DNA_ORIENTATION=+